MKTATEILATGVENRHWDAKLQFTPNEYGWLELVKDIVAFANRDGGYIVFGVANKGAVPVGIDQVTFDELGDANKIKQKLRRHISLDIPIEVRIDSSAGIKLIVIEIQNYNNSIYVFDSDGSYAQSSGALKYVFHKGTIIIRGDAGNEILSSGNESNLRHRIVNSERNRILQGITNFVNEPDKYKLIHIADGGSMPVKFVKDDVSAKKLTFDVDGAGKVWAEMSDFMDILHRLNGKPAEMDDVLMARYRLKELNGQFPSLKREVLFCLAARCPNFPKFIYAGPGLNFGNEAEIALEKCYNVAEKVRLIYSIGVIDKNFAKQLFSKLAHAEKTYASRSCKFTEESNCANHSIGYYDSIPVSNRNIEFINDYIGKLAITYQDLHLSRMAVSLDYKLYIQQVVRT